MKIIENNESLIIQGKGIKFLRIKSTINNVLPKDNIRHINKESFSIPRDKFRLIIPIIESLDIVVSLELMNEAKEYKSTLDKHLEAKNKGEVDYDFKEDTLFFKIKNREYLKSIDFDDLVVDIDKEGFITGIQIFGASKLFKLSKEALRNVKHMSFNTKVENKVITLEFQFACMQRNKVVEMRGQNLVRESDSPLTEGDVLCTVPA